VLDGASRYLVHWELRERMTTADVETVLQRARERYPDARPRVISDNVLPALSSPGSGKATPSAFMGALCHR
jgi:transposase InsO family protein